MRSVDFFGLTRAAQDHFIDSTTGAQPPSPVLVTRGGPKGHRAGWGVAVVGLVLAVLFFLRGFGDLSAASLVHGVPLAAVWAVLFVLVFGGLLHALAGDRATSALPWKAGVYAFPNSVVDARTDKLRFFEVTEIERVEGDGGTVRLVFRGETLTFQASPEQAARARAVLEDARGGLAEEERGRPSISPIAEPRVSSPLAPTDPRRSTVPSWVRMRFVYAALLAILIGPAIWFARNGVSDDRAFAAARAKNDVASYRAYLEHGVKHRDEVKKTLLPRAELTLAQKENSVDAILAYQKSHPNTAIQKEVDASLRTAMLAELEIAKKAGTLAALQDFVKKRPEHGLGPELKEATHAVYQAALTAFKATSNEKDPQVNALFERALAYAEAHGAPMVSVRFKEQPSTSLNRADKFVTKQPLFNGETSYPSKYFEGGGKFDSARTELAKQLVDKLSSSFPKEILTFSVGAPLPTDAEAIPAVTAPTLLVTHRVEWTGTAYPSHHPRGIYVGLNYHFDAVFQLPNDPKPFKHHAVIAKNVPTNVLKEYKGSSTPGEAEKAAYEAMSKESFEAFAQRLLGAIYRKK